MHCYAMHLVPPSSRLPSSSDQLALAMYASLCTTQLSNAPFRLERVLRAFLGTVLHFLSVAFAASTFSVRLDVSNRGEEVALGVSFRFFVTSTSLSPSAPDHCGSPIEHRSCEVALVHPIEECILIAPQ